MSANITNLVIVNTTKHAGISMLIKFVIITLVKFSPVKKDILENVVSSENTIDVNLTHVSINT